jgi:carbonic anhydrase/acetyltransferase-like protein (isoleucine patch superfamily)
VRARRCPQGTAISERSVIDRVAGIDKDVRIGARVNARSEVYVTGFSAIEDNVFIGPGASTRNVDTMSRRGADYDLRWATIQRAVRIGGSAMLERGAETGAEMFLAPGAGVTKGVPRAFVLGVWARQMRQVRDEERLERWR